MVLKDPVALRLHPSDNVAVACSPLSCGKHHLGHDGDQVQGIHPTFNGLLGARARISPFVHNTPVLTCATLNQMLGASLYFKCENFQKAGAFKSRGATNAVMSLTDEEAQNGVLTHSSGNHGAALALAAKGRGIPAYIVMPQDAPQVKVLAAQEYGGKITFCKPSSEAREQTAATIMRKTGAVLIHPYNDERVIAGQGTCAMELMERIRDLDAVLAPVGGGGLLSGTAIACKGLNPDVIVFGCEPEHADDAHRSLRAGKIIPVRHPSTIADGLRTSLGSKTFPFIKALVADILLASEESIIAAMRL